jgi:hypothetical protein
MIFKTDQMLNQLTNFTVGMSEDSQDHDNKCDNPEESHFVYNVCREDV